MSWNQQDQEAYHAARESRAKYAMARMYAYGFAVIAIAAMLTAWTLSGNARKLRSELLHVQDSAARWESDFSTCKLRRKSCVESLKDQATAIERLRSELAATQADTKRLADIDTAISEAGFESFEQMLRHATRCREISWCSSSLATCREWLGYCEGGFWRPLP